MKLIVAIIRPDRLNEVLEALYRSEVRGLTVSRVLGHGGETERVETYRGTTVKVDLQEKVRLEIGVSEPFVLPTVNAILKSARTGEVGDGKVFVLDVAQVFRIRTGEQNEAAVTPAEPVVSVYAGKPDWTPEPELLSWPEHTLDRAMLRAVGFGDISHSIARWKCSNIS
jgi:nitrogen regulatory protein P-II 1